MKILISPHLLTPQEKEVTEPHELLHQITGLYSEKYKSGGLGTIWGISSLDEVIIINLSKKLLKANAIIDFNKKHLSRKSPMLREWI